MASMPLVTLLVFGFIIGTGTMAQDSAYCRLSPDHTMCRYKNGVLGPACGKNAALIPMTDKERINILNAHNKLRSKVALGNETQGEEGSQPKAANMMALVWDTELEEIAKRWALQCIFGNDRQRKTSRFFWVNQNAVSSSGYVPTWESQVQSWYSEVTRMTLSQVSSFEELDERNPVGHYTQVVWANTNYVGCAGVKWGTPGIKVHLFCNYGLGGNLQGSNVYIQGEPGTKCPIGSKADSSNGLCILSAGNPTAREATPVDAE